MLNTTSASQISVYSSVAVRQTPPSHALKKLPICWEKNTTPNNAANFAVPKSCSVRPEAGGTAAFPVRSSKTEDYNKIFRQQQECQYYDDAGSIQPSQQVFHGNVSTQSAAENSPNQSGDPIGGKRKSRNLLVKAIRSDLRIKMWFGCQYLGVSLISS